MATTPSNPFDFTGASSLQDIFNKKTRESFDRLYRQEVRADKIEDFLFDACEAPGVNESVRRQLADDREQWLVDEADKRLNIFSQLYQEAGEQIYHDWAWQASQAAIRIVKIKGSEAHPLVQEIARDVSALPEAYEPKTLWETLLGAYKRVNPLPESNHLFDLHDVHRLKEVARMRRSFEGWRKSRATSDRAVDFLLEDLEAEKLDDRVRQELADYLTPIVTKDLKKTFEVLNGRTNDVHFTLLWDDYVRHLSQQAIRLANIKGDSADRLLQEVAREVSSLSEEELDSLGILKSAGIRAKALIRGYEQAQKPLPPKRKPKPGHFEI